MWKQISPRTNSRRSLYIYTSYLLNMLGIGIKEKQKLLWKNYSKWSRKQLTDKELEDFTEKLEALIQTNKLYKKVELSNNLDNKLAP